MSRGKLESAAGTYRLIYLSYPDQLNVTFDGTKGWSWHAMDRWGTTLRGDIPDGPAQDLLDVLWDSMEAAKSSELGLGIGGSSRKPLKRTK